MANLVGRDLHALHVGFGGFQFLLERVIKLVEDLGHLFLGGRDIVELVFHLGRELEVENLGKLLDQEVGDGHAQVRSHGTAVPFVRHSRDPEWSG